MDLFFIAYPAVGLLSGVLAGLLGIGGGIVIVPALLFILPHAGFAEEITPHVAVATSLASVIITSIAAAYSHHRRGAVQWPVVRRMGAGLLLGAAAGAYVAGALPGSVLRFAFGVFALITAAVLAFRLQPPMGGPLPSWPALTGMGVLIGHVSALVGIGGGTMTVPFLQWRRVPLHQAIATSSACGLPIALGGSLSFALMHQYPGTPALGYIHWPAACGIGLASLLTAPLGVRLAHHLSVRTLTRIFAVFLALVAARLLSS